MSLKGKYAIVGYGFTKPERHASERTATGIIAEAAAKAIEDAGLRKEKIDGLLSHCAGANLESWTADFSDYIQIRPTMAGIPGIQGANGAGMVWRAAAAIEAGMCDYVLCCGGSAEIPQRASATPRGGAPRASGFVAGYVSPSGGFDAPYGAAGAPSTYALVAQRHAFLYGTTDAQRARVAVDQRFNAAENPMAIFYGQPITVEDVLKSRVISTPLHLLECVMPATGAAAFIVTSAEHAKSLRHPPVYMLGAGECVSHEPIAQIPDITVSPSAVSARRAFDMAGVYPSDINMASIYDCFTITVMITLEDAGFMKKGESGPFYESTDTTFKGKFPVNTHGGQLSWGQPQGAGAGGISHVIDAVEQLTGRAGNRQIPNCELAFVNGNGGTLGKHVSLILGREQS